MQQRIPNDNEKALLGLLGCPQSELRKHSDYVYEWRGQYLEILTEKQRQRGGVPASWYSTIGEWKIREMGNKSEKVKKIRSKKHEQSTKTISTNGSR